MSLSRDFIESLTPRQLRSFLSGLTDLQASVFLHEWHLWARREQLPPDGEWSVWMALAGRGWGKTRTGAEWVRSIKDDVSRVAMVAPTAADCRDVMVEGESGIMAISPPWDRPTYEPSKRRLSWSNGAQAYLYSAEEPDRLRGPQHGSAWCDEVASWRYDQETWDMLQFGLRLGRNPQVLVTTTPRPTPLVRELASSPATRVTGGSTYDNRANLPEPFFEKIITKYEGTRLGRQELLAEILTDVPGALWTLAMIDAKRCKSTEVPQLTRVAVGVDPSGGGGDSQGIVAAGRGVDGRAYVLEDASCNLSPDGWGERVVQVYDRHTGDVVAAEKNYGGDMVKSTIHTQRPTLNVKMVNASRGKAVRAEPVAALYEQGRVSHVGMHSRLEDQMTFMTTHGYDGDGSPDRLDALVWVLTELMLDENHYGMLEAL